MLAESVKNHQVLDLEDIFDRFAFHYVCKLAFNFDPDSLNNKGETSAPLMQALQDTATISTGGFIYAILHLWKLKKALNIGSERELKKINFDY